MFRTKPLHALRQATSLGLVIKLVCACSLLTVLPHSALAQAVQHRLFDYYRSDLCMYPSDLSREAFTPLDWDTGEINNGANVNRTEPGNIHVRGKIDGSSHVTLISTGGSIIIDDRIDGGSSVTLQAAGSISIRGRVDGGSHVKIQAGGSVSLGDRIDGGNTYVSIVAGTGIAIRNRIDHDHSTRLDARTLSGDISIGDKIDGGVWVRLATGGGGIHIAGKIDHDGTEVTTWPPNVLRVGGSIWRGAHVFVQNWTVDMQRVVPGFMPSTSGFHFSNSWPRGTNYPIVSLPVIGKISGDAGNGLCGGFSFLVTDMFLSNPRILPPQTTTPPADGTPLFNRLVKRNLESIVDNNGAKVVQWIQLSDHDVQIQLEGSGLAHRMVYDEWPKIKADIDSGRPSPINLVGKPKRGVGDVPGIINVLKGHCHQVVVYGYRLTPENILTLDLYDPNDPNDDAPSTLVCNISYPENTISLSVPQVEKCLENGVEAGFFRGFFHSDYQFRAQH
jgi:hypothetical protein